MNGTQELHVIFGTGSVGTATAEALLKRGKRVRFVSRRGTNPLKDRPGTEAVSADATIEAQRNSAAAGATVVYDCTNPPQYNKWAELLPPLTRGVLAAAESAGARLVQAGSLYMYGQTNSPMTETTPVNPNSGRGKLRADLAAETMAAHTQGRVQATICRASDFYGITEQAVLGTRAWKALLEGRPIDLLGNPDKLHSYTLVSDFGEALATLGVHPEAAGRIWHAPTAPGITTREMVQLAAKISGKKPKIRAASRFMLAVASIFIQNLRGIGEMLYQFENDFVLDSSEFEKTFAVQPTPIESGLRQTLDSL